jgi:ribosomal protein L33
MKAIIENRYCKHCGELIPETRNMGALYCTYKCGWTFRNRRNAKEKMDIQKNELGLYRSYKVLKEIVSRGYSDISKETAKVLGFDVNCFTGIIKIDPALKTTEYKLFDFSYTIYGDRIKIKKLNNGCI